MESISQIFPYDVLLSFRGEDTRYNFTSHLHKALTRHDFLVFHDKSLPRGLGIAPQLLKAINESKILVVVFSTNYPYSKWCLDELTHMMQCMHTNDQQIVLPVFLANFKHSDADILHHVTEFDPKWREALRELGELRGLRLQDDANGDGEALVVQIVERIRMILHGSEDYLNVADLHPVVGIESRMQKVIPLLNTGLDDGDGVRVVAICGPAGIGKTTIAKATYNRLAIHFKAQFCCFLPDVKTIFGEPNGKVILQKKLILNLVQSDESKILIDNYHEGNRRRIEGLIRNQKVLFVLDDVDDDEQLKILGIERGILGCGSRIIVTTRDVSSVEDIKPDAKYEPQLLDENESLEMFCLNAFEQKHPKEGYGEVSMEAVGWCAGHPGVLKHWATYLRPFQNVEQWPCVLRYLMQNPSAECLDE